MKEIPTAKKKKKNGTRTREKKYQAVGIASRNWTTAKEIRDLLHFFHFNHFIRISKSTIFQNLSRNITILLFLKYSIPIKHNCFENSKLSRLLSHTFPENILRFEEIGRLFSKLFSLWQFTLLSLPPLPPFFPRKNFRHRPPSVFEDLEIEERIREREKREVHRESKAWRDRILDPSDSMTSGSLSTTTTTTDRIFMSGEETSSDHGVVFAAVTTEILMGRIEIVMITACLPLYRPTLSPVQSPIFPDFLSFPSKRNFFLSYFIFEIIYYHCWEF